MIATVKLANFSIVTLGFAKVSISNPEATLSQLRSRLGREIQIVRADCVAGKEHLNLAASHVSLAIQREHRRSKNIAMELLLYISGQRQITRAIQRIGVTSKTKEIVVIFCTRRTEELDEPDLVAACIELFGGIRDDSVIEIESKTKIGELRKVYEITSLELEAARFPHEDVKETLKRLVVERSALLAIE